MQLTLPGIDFNKKKEVKMRNVPPAGTHLFLHVSLLSSYLTLLTQKTLSLFIFPKKNILGSRFTRFDICQKLLHLFYIVGKNQT